MILKRRVIAFSLLLLIVLLSGCGPIMSTSRRIDAEEALAKAEDRFSVEIYCQVREQSA